MRRGLILGASGGLAAGAWIGAADAAVVLAATGRFWIGPAALLEAVAVWGVAGAVAGTLAAGAVRALGRTSDAAAAALGAGVGLAPLLAVLAGFHLFDVGLPIQLRRAPLPYAAAAAASAAAGALLGGALALAVRRGASIGAALGTVAALPLAAWLVAWLAAAPPEPDAAADGPRPDLFLVVLDTTRRDALSIYGSERATTPALDALGGRGAVFTSAYATSSWTPPSHASLFTGLHPSEHRTTGAQTALLPGPPTLAELLSARGYATLFVSAKDLLTRSDGWTRGFETAVTVNIEDRAELAHRRILARLAGRDATSDLSIDLILRWAEGERARGRPLFVFLNLNDPHSPYRAREPWYARFAAAPEARGADAAKVAALAHGGDLSETPRELAGADRALLRARYDSEAAAMDASLARLLGWIETDGSRAGRTLFVTADHGELLGEHGLLYHGKYPYQELVHVPFVAWAEPALAARVDDLVSLVDVFPTFCDLAGAPRPPGVRGRNLFREPGPAAVFAEDVRRSADGALERRKIAIAHDAKLVWSSGAPAAFFDLARDPGELRAVNGGDPRARALERLLAERLPLGGASEPAPALDEATRERLRALGYLE